VAAALVPDGLFLFDLSTPGRNAGAQLHRQWHDRDEWTLYMEAREDAAEQILDRRITIFCRTGPDGYPTAERPPLAGWKVFLARKPGRQAARPPSDQAAGH
jgi:hypothetical protein